MASTSIIQHPGQLIVLSGPSGVGKGTLCKALLERHPNWQWSVSATSRDPRDGESDGVHYHFYSPQAFQSLIKDNGLFEWAEYNGNYYGTPIAPVLTALTQGNTLLMEIDVQGALQVKQRYPYAHLVFIAPPSVDVLKERLTLRGTESDDVMADRLAIAEKELTQQDDFDQVFINNDLNTCLGELDHWASQLKSPVASTRTLS